MYFCFYKNTSDFSRFIFFLLHRTQIPPEKANVGGRLKPWKLQQTDPIEQTLGLAISNNGKTAEAGPGL